MPIKIDFSATDRQSIGRANSKKRFNISLYTPDCLKSGLSTVLDFEIRQRLLIEVVQRYRLRITPKVAKLLYPHCLQDEARWPLIEGLLCSGDSIMTVWNINREKDFKDFNELKGHSCPMLAHESSIRARFACDNPIANLLHCSDDADMAERELKLLLNSRTIRPISAALFQSSTCSEPKRLSLQNARHSGIATLYRLLRERNSSQAATMLVPMSAKDAFLHFNHLLGTLSITNEYRRQCVSLYKEASANELFQMLRKTTVVSAWDRLILSCGASSYHCWRKDSVNNAVDKLHAYLLANDIYKWVFTAGVVIHNLGSPRLPNDIDIRTHEKQLQRFSALFKSPIYRAQGDGFECNCVAGTWNGWGFEILGDFLFDDGRVDRIPNDVLRNADSLNMINPYDLIVEYASMGRGGRNSGDLLKITEILKCIKTKVKLSLIRTKMMNRRVKSEFAKSISSLCHAHNNEF
jgi:nucleoside diphosphate kinase